MNDKIDDGGPAFPVEVSNLSREAHQTGNNTFQTYGMSLRDHFAGLALQGMLADLPKTYYGLDWKASVVDGAYQIADLMLSRRQIALAGDAS